MASRRSLWAAVVAACLLALLALGLAACDPVEEEGGDDPELNTDDDDSEGDDDVNPDDDDDDDGWDYPYYLVVGNGQAETLDLVTITGRESFAIDTDVRPTGSAINQTLTRGDGLYAVCSLSNSVIVYALSDLAIEREISLGVGNNPMAIAFASDYTAYVTNFVPDTVTLYDLAAGTDEGDRLMATIPMPDSDALPVDTPGTQTWARPNGIEHVGGRVYVALSNLSGTFVASGPGVLAVVDGTSKAINNVIELTGRDPIAVVHDAATDRLLVASAGDFDSFEGFVGNGGVDVIDLETEERVDFIETGGAPFELTICPNRKAFAGNGREAVVLSFDADSGEVLPSVDIAGGGRPVRPVLRLGAGLRREQPALCRGLQPRHAVRDRHRRRQQAPDDPGDGGRAGHDGFHSLTS